MPVEVLRTDDIEPANEILGIVRENLEEYAYAGPGAFRTTPACVSSGKT